MDYRPPGLLGATLMDWRAGRMGDPIEKLRYLRLATQPRTPVRARLALVRGRWKVCLMALAFVALRIQTVSDAGAVTRQQIVGLAVPAGRSPAPPRIWLVEKSKDFDVYSNGLRIEKRHAVSNTPRRYLVFDPQSAEPLSTDWRTEPAGIVFHTTESPQAPFEERQNTMLKYFGVDLLNYVRRNCSYHYVIDRFGRVYRIVEESDAANHAGKSIWGDTAGLYVNLNASFLGVSFEALTRDSGGRPTASRTQVQAARMLADMLRDKYRIPPGNCVTHAQVSVNPDNKRIGYHTDWADNFPYQELGLPDNYAQPTPSLYAFGFGYDSEYVKSAGARLWKGLLLAEEQVRQEAAARGVSVAQHRAGLQQRYLRTIAAIQEWNAHEEMESR